MTFPLVPTLLLMGQEVALWAFPCSLGAPSGSAEGGGWCSCTKPGWVPAGILSPPPTACQCCPHPQLMSTRCGPKGILLQSKSWCPDKLKANSHQGPWSPPEKKHLASCHQPRALPSSPCIPSLLSIEASAWGDESRWVLRLRSESPLLGGRALGLKVAIGLVQALYLLSKQL